MRFVVPSSGRADGFEDLPAAEVVQVRSAGVDWVRDRVPRRATLCSARGARDSAVAEWVVAAVLADAKRAREVGEGQAAGTWRRLGLDDVAGRRVVIVGYGSIGREAGAAAARPGLHGRRGGPRTRATACTASPTSHG